ncbi:MAG: electron transfer flavoprotein subunit alpha/FixB family protein [Desulfarculaceae bacterium]|jgi:electron transfer flavoprotein alpha subunit
MSVLVIAEHREGTLREATLEALGAARTLGAGEVLALVLATEPGPLAAELAPFCDEVLTMAQPSLDPPLAEAWLPAARAAVLESGASLVLMPHSSWGMELGPRLAEEMDAPLAPDISALEYSEGGLKGQRMVFGGKLTASCELMPAGLYVATLRAGVFSAPDAKEPAPIRELAPAAPEQIATAFVGYIKQAAGDVDITAAKILVSVGRGIEGPDNLPLVEALAEALGGVVSCSRPVADKKWLPKTRQVGTSGQTVRPDIYLALGISGAFQHVAGMQGAGTIIALNKDPKAPIFRVAHYGIVGDLFELLPLVTEKVKALT